MGKSSNIVWRSGAVTRAERQKLNRHKNMVLWFTGLSGSGKSTISHAVESRLHELQLKTFVLDGDNIRHGLCEDLGFSEEDRMENIRRAGHVAKLMLEAGVIVLTAFISPFKADRNRVRSLLAADDFIEIYCRCPLEICERRDVKGLYRLARSGKLDSFTGISSPYEEPDKADLVIDTDKLSVDASVDLVMRLLHERGLICQTS